MQSIIVALAELLILRVGLISLGRALIACAGGSQT